MREQYTSGYEEYSGTGTKDTVATFPMTVDSTNEIVSVPTGQYQCYKYHAPEVVAHLGGVSNEIDPEDMFLSDAGPVKMIFYASNSKPAYYWELLSTNFRR